MSQTRRPNTSDVSLDVADPGSRPTYNDFKSGLQESPGRLSKVGLLHGENEDITFLSEPRNCYSEREAPRARSDPLGVSG